MGYESRIYIVRKETRMDPEVNKRYGEVLSVFNLGKVSPEFEKWFDQQKPTDCYIYADNGDTVVLEDEYGDPLKECDPFELKNRLRYEYAEQTMARCEMMQILGGYVIPHVINLYKYEIDRIAFLHYGY